MSTSFDNSHLTALTDLINAAVQDVIFEYAAVGKAVPTLDSLEPGPFDIPEETPAKLSRAVQIIEAACAQLAHTVASPGHVVVNVSVPERFFVRLCLTCLTEITRGMGIFGIVMATVELKLAENNSMKSQLASLL
ncbi:hypothetical protein PM082_022519 [Marasmius tenuissimus]|nr:hypothetical protein PM082_022519 [Marasmius tenuissimus]